MTVPVRRSAPARSPIHQAPFGTYLLTTDSAAAANTGAAVGFQTVPPGTPNPINQQGAGQVIASLSRANAIALPLDGAMHCYGIPLPSYFGWVDLSFFVEASPDMAGTVGAIAYPMITNGRGTDSIAATDPGRFAQMVSLTMLWSLGNLGNESVATPSTWPNDVLQGNTPPTAAVFRWWSPPGQNDLWIFTPEATTGDPPALFWYTLLASPNTEAAIASST